MKWRELWRGFVPLLLTFSVAQHILQADMVMLSRLGDSATAACIALNKSGRAVGCARITPDGRIERMVILPHEHRAQIGAALIEVLNDYAHEKALANISKTKRKSQSSRMAVCGTFMIRPARQAVRECAACVPRHRRRTSPHRNPGRRRLSFDVTQSPLQGRLAVPLQRHRAVA